MTRISDTKLPPPLSLITIMMMKARCGHVVEKFYSNSHHGLCRECHSNFAFLLELEQRYGEDGLIEYWYAKILTYLSSERKGEDAGCFIDHLVEFYQRKLIQVPSKENYIRKMLYMLHSLQEPIDMETLR